MKIDLSRGVCCLLLLVVISLTVSAQNVPQKVPGDINAPAKPAATPQPTAIGPEFKRWFDLDAANLITRYRYIEANNGTTLNNHQQYQVFIKGHFQFDAKARYRVNWLVQTGNSFTSGFNATGLGTGAGQTNFYVKQLYFDAKPSKKFEFEVGGIDINRGEGTEAVTYDNDGYLTGERIVVRAPRSVFFDEISLTNAYLGDINHPSIFPRLHRLGEANYHQFLVRKQATKEIGFSVDYTFDSGTDRLHEAVRFKAPKVLYFNTIVFETYQRLDPNRDAGMNTFAEKVINKRLTLNGGFSRIDRRLTLNGDRFAPGKRLYILAPIKLSHAFTLSPVFFEGIGRLPTPTTPRRRFELVLTYNLLEDLHHHHIL